MLTNILAQAESVKPSISFKIAVRAIPSGQGSDPKQHQSRHQIYVHEPAALVEVLLQACLWDLIQSH
jgi:hypothetical protein